MMLSGSIDISLYACIRARDDSRSVSIVDPTYAFTLLVVLNDFSGVAVDTGMGRRMVSTMRHSDRDLVKRKSTVN